MDEELKRKILAIAFKAVIPMALMGIFGLVAGSSGFMRVWADFNWLFSVRMFFGGGATIMSLVTLVSAILLVDPPRDTRAWKALGISAPATLVLWTVFAGLFPD